MKTEKKMEKIIKTSEIEQKTGKNKFSFFFYIFK